MSSGGPLQTAILSKLDAVAELAGIVFDAVPQPVSYPYVVIGEDTISEMGTDDSTGESVLVQIHTWSQRKGMKQINAMQAAINGALDRQSLTVAGWHFISCDFVQHIKMLDPDGETRHGVSEFRVMLDTL